MSTDTTATITAVSDATFAEAVGPGTGLVAVEFSVAWCASCRMMARVVEALAAEYASRLRLLHLDTDANPATTARLNVRALPALLVFRDGQLVDRIVGVMPKAALRQRIEHLVAA